MWRNFLILCWKLFWENIVFFSTQAQLDSQFQPIFHQWRAQFKCFYTMYHSWKIYCEGPRLQKSSWILWRTNDKRGYSCNPLQNSLVVSLKLFSTLFKAALNIYEVKCQPRFTWKDEFYAMWKLIRRTNKRRTSTQNLLCTGRNLHKAILIEDLFLAQRVWIKEKAF